MFTGPLLVHGAAVLATVAIVAVLVLLVRHRTSPYGPQDWMVLGALTGYAVEWSSIVPAVAQRWVSVGGPLAPPVVNLLALFVEQYCVAAFFLHAVGSRTGSRLLAAGFVVATAGLVVLIGAGALDRPPGVPPADPAAVVLNIWIGVYAITATQVAVTTAWRYSKRTGQPVTGALRGIAVSLTTVNVFATIGGGVNTQLSWLGHPMPSWLAVWSKNVVDLGIAGFLICACVPGLIGWLRRGRLGWLRRRAYRELAPLWQLMYEAFPQSMLRPLPRLGLGDRLSWVSPHRLYYRRAVECRDGLVQISPYLPEPVPTDPESLATALRLALRHRASGAPPAGSARILAVPAAPDIDGDGAALRALSRALRASAATADGKA